MHRLAPSLLVLAAACGGSSEPAAPSPALSTTVSTTAPAASRDDVVVATVAGRPVWGSCVAAQAARGTTRDLALRECVDFEVLAQAAEARGLAATPEVHEALRSALVDRFVELDFEAKHQSRESVSALLDRQLARVRSSLEQPERRDSAFIRVEVDAKAPPDRVAAARQVADAIHARLGDERGLYIDHLRRAASSVSPDGFKVAVENYHPSSRLRLVPAYGEALFGIPEVGRVSPVVRTPWGWDIVLLEELTPARTYTLDEATAEILPEIRREYFRRWVEGIVKRYGAITYDEAQLAALENL